MLKRATVVAMATAIIGAALVLSAGAAPAAGEDRGIAAIRAVTKRYHDEATALAAGYIRVDDCVEVPGLGYMGYHYIHPERIDGTLQVGKPEVLLYADGPDGTRILTGVEYLVVDEDQDLATDRDRPVLFQHPFDGPMEGHEPGMPVHYDLHVWAWESNPAGDWQAWHTGMSC